MRWGLEVRGPKECACSVHVQCACAVCVCSVHAVEACESSQRGSASEQAQKSHAARLVRIKGRVRVRVRGRLGFRLELEEPCGARRVSVGGLGVESVATQLGVASLQLTQPRGRPRLAVSPPRLAQACRAPLADPLSKVRLGLGVQGEAQTCE